MPVFIANVPAPLKVGDRIEIGGKIKENARKMSVNLCAQEGEEPRDVVLHFDVRFHRDNIISLSRKNGVWIGSGNYDTNYNMFVPGTIFRIIFEIKDTDVITIYCQGKFHSNFLPKIPLSMAKYIVAWADVEKITHCYFHFNPKVPLSEELQASLQASTFSNPAPPPRPATACAASGEPKRGHRPRKKATDSLKAASSNETSGEETAKPRPKAEGRADRFFYETLMCQPQEHKFGSPNMAKLRREAAACAHSRAEFGRRYKAVALSDSEKNYSDGDDYSEELSKIDSSIDSDVIPDLAMQKRMRRSKFPFAQVVNFMGKRERRN